MQPNDLSISRRKELVGTIGWLAWILGPLTSVPSEGGLASFCFTVGWVCIVVWVALDERDRRGGWSFWTILALLTGPVGFALYYLTQPRVPAVCLRCGATTAGATSPCPACGNTPILAKLRSGLSEVYSSLANSLARGPAERTRETAKHLAFAFAAVVVLSFLILGGYAGRQAEPVAVFVMAMLVLSVAAYWVLVAWWVYLDSAWRRMDGVTWAVLTLVTNLVGLVTYLVVRGPDPRTCPRCGSSVPINLKFCPFCGSQAQSVCPRCQAPVKTGWQFCSACAAPLTGPRQSTERQAQPSPDDPRSEPVQPDDELATVIAGTVVDAITDSPIGGARVTVDSSSGGTSTSTDAVGRFRIPMKEERPYVLVASADGYVPQPKPYAPGTEESRHIKFTLRQTE
jgi:hypothetical protein